MSTSHPPSPLPFLLQATMPFRASTSSATDSSPAELGTNLPGRVSQACKKLAKAQNVLGKFDTGDSGITLDLTGCGANADDGKEYLEESRRIKFLALGKGIPDSFRDLYNPLASSSFAQLFTRLKGLSLDVAPYRHPTFDLDDLLATLAGIGTLRQLHLNFPCTGTHLSESSHWQKLFQNLSHVKFRASMTIRESRLLLSFCSRAVEIDLELDITDPPPQQEELKSLEFTLANLRWLKIATSESVDVVLQHVKCPNLQNLFIMDGLPILCDTWTWKSPIYICDTLSHFLPSCRNLKQLVLVVRCSWRDIARDQPKIKCMETIPEFDLQALNRKGSLDGRYAAQVERGFSKEGGNSMTVCSICQESDISHIGQSKIQGAHIGTPLQPVDGDWELAFWNTKDTLEGFMWELS